MKDNFAFWKMAWDLGCVSEENLRMFVSVEITEEQFKEITGIKY